MEEDIFKAINILRKYNSEANMIEAKSSTLGFPKKCYDTFSSFSNKYGGIIIFGLDERNNFKTEGVYDVNDIQKQTTNLCSDSMYPQLRPDILSLEFEGKIIVAVKIEELTPNNKPCYYKPAGIRKGSYTRIGDRDDLMTDYELNSLLTYKEHVFEDIRADDRVELNDLDLKKIDFYIEKIKNSKPHFSTNDFNRSLKLCGIVDKDLYPTLAGNMIFGKYPQNFYPQLFVACVVVPGIELGDTGNLGERFIDNRRVDGNIEEMLEETIKFIRRNMKTSIIIDKSGKRINREEYPLEAVREAVLNALIHRDYSVQTESSYISVYMYSDRIEIVSPGALYGSNKLEKLGTASSLEVRNPTIIRILEELDYIENRHSGIPTMKREMEKYGLPAPEFYDERDCFKVILRNNLKDNNK